jgi:hypothetical protein
LGRIAVVEARIAEFQAAAGTDDFDQEGLGWAQEALARQNKAL